MDPIAVVLAALATAAAEVVGNAVSDGYQGLKELIVRKFGDAKPELAERLDQYEEDQETWAKPTAKALREAGVGEDAEVLARAEQLLDQADQVSPGVKVGLIQATNVVVGSTFNAPVNFYGGTPATRPGEAE